MTRREYCKYIHEETPAIMGQGGRGGLRPGETGEASAYGAYPVMPAEDFFAQLDVRGEHRHALLCVLPGAEVRILGRSHAWPGDLCRQRRPRVACGVPHSRRNALLTGGKNRPKAPRGKMGQYQGSLV